MQAAANVKGSMPAGNGRKVLAHYIKKLKEGGYPEKAADKQFADYTDRELDALFDLSVDEYDKMVDDAYNEVRMRVDWGMGSGDAAARGERERGKRPRVDSTIL